MASATTTMMAVAFVRLSGVKLIEESLVSLLDRGGQAEIIFGLDFLLTEARAVKHIIGIKASYPALTFFAFSNPYLPGREPTFHPKLYMFEQVDGDWTAIIGSSNLTRGGLISNVEVGVAIDGRKTAPLITDALAFYRSVRGRESLFVPDDDYLEAYEKVRSAVEGSQRGTTKSPKVQEAIDRLRQLEVSLPGTVSTQKELIVLAIKSLRTSPDSWVHWTKIAQFVKARARDMEMEYKWDTLDNSVRGRLNEHTIGKRGDNLFERKGGISGRFGMYRLAPKGESFVGRVVVE